MADYVVSITGDQVIDALADFIAPFVAGAEIVRTQVNRTPPPPGVNFVLLNEILQVDLETPSVTPDSVTQTATISGPKRIDIQVDFYGDSAWEYSNAVKTVYRSEYAPLQFGDGIKPLYCSDAMQHPLITGEHQYLTRWTITASLQYNATLTVPWLSANELSVTTVTAADLIQ